MKTAMVESQKEVRKSTSKVAFALAGTGTEKEELALLDLAMSVGRRLLEKLLPYDVKLVRAVCSGKTDGGSPGIKFLMVLDQPEVGGEYKVWATWLKPQRKRDHCVFFDSAQFPTLGHVDIAGRAVVRSNFEEVWPGEISSQTRIRVVVECLQNAIVRAIVRWREVIAHYPAIEEMVENLSGSQEGVPEE